MARLLLIVALVPVIASTPPDMLIVEPETAALVPVRAKVPPDRLFVPFRVTPLPMPLTEKVPEVTERLLLIVVLAPVMSTAPLPERLIAELPETVALGPRVMVPPDMLVAEVPFSATLLALFTVNDPEVMERLLLIAVLMPVMISAPLPERLIAELPETEALVPVSAKVPPDMLVAEVPFRATLLLMPVTENVPEVMATLLFIVALDPVMSIAPVPEILIPEVPEIVALLPVMARAPPVMEVAAAPFRARVPLPLLSASVPCVMEKSFLKILPVPFSARLLVALVKASVPELKTRL